jgi:hypothetical protein
MAIFRRRDILKSGLGLLAPVSSVLTTKTARSATSEVVLDDDVSPLPATIVTVDINKYFVSWADSAERSIKHQVFDERGFALSTDTFSGPVGTKWCRPAAAGWQQGFAVVWLEKTGAQNDVMLLIQDGGAVAVTQPIKVNTIAADEKTSPSIDIVSDWHGQKLIAVTWSPAQPWLNVLCQLFYLDGTKRGDPITASNSEELKSGAQVAALRTGGFAVAWNSGRGVELRFYDDHFAAIGQPVRADLMNYVGDFALAGVSSDAASTLVDGKVFLIAKGFSGSVPELRQRTTFLQTLTYNDRGQPGESSYLTPPRSADEQYHMSACRMPNTQSFACWDAVALETAASRVFGCLVWQGSAVGNAVINLASVQPAADVNHFSPKATYVGQPGAGQVVCIWNEQQANHDRCALKMRVLDNAL